MTITATSQFRRALQEALSSPDFKGVHEKDIEAQAKVSRGYLRVLRNRTKTPQLDKLEALCAVLGIRFDAYYEGPSAVTAALDPKDPGTTILSVHGKPTVSMSATSALYKGFQLVSGKRLTSEGVQDVDTTALEQLKEVLQQQAEDGRRAVLLLNYLEGHRPTTTVTKP